MTSKGNIFKNGFKWIFMIAIFLFLSNRFYAQPALPQRGITVAATQDLHFGTFALTGGGEGILTVGTNGVRTAVQNVYLSSLSPTAQPAIFDIKLCQGRNVTITHDATATLTRDGGGGTMTLDIGPAKREGIDNRELLDGDSFPVQNNCNFITILRVGGTLHIPSNSLDGLYTGYFSITFEQE